MTRYLVKAKHCPTLINPDNYTRTIAIEISSRKIKYMASLLAHAKNQFRNFRSIVRKLSIIYNNTPMKKNRSWYGLPKLKDFFSEETSSLWKEDNNRIWFQIKKKMSCWNRTESGSSSTNREMETPQCAIKKKRMTPYKNYLKSYSSDF